MHRATILSTVGSLFAFVLKGDSTPKALKQAKEFFLKIIQAQLLET
jgi:hypothetical protein